MIDHDPTATFRSYPLVSTSGARGPTVTSMCFATRTDALEFVNVNNSAVESRTGTDMIYYYVPTRSFVLVQYKRIDFRNGELLVDDRLCGQLDRLEQVAKASRPAANPSDWRLGQDPCFLKVASLARVGEWGTGSSGHARHVPACCPMSGCCSEKDDATLRPQARTPSRLPRASNGT